MRHGAAHKEVRPDVSEIQEDHGTSERHYPLPPPLNQSLFGATRARSTDANP